MDHARAAALEAARAVLDLSAYGLWVDYLALVATSHPTSCPPSCPGRDSSPPATTTW